MCVCVCVCVGGGGGGAACRVAGYGETSGWVAGCRCACGMGRLLAGWLGVGVRVGWGDYWLGGWV